MKKIIILMFLLVTMGCNNIKENKSSSIVNKMSPKEVLQHINDNDYLIIDVRNKEEYDSGHIKTAINIPLSEIEQSVIDNKKIIVYCKSGVRSNKAANILVNKGYRVYDMGGIINWNYELVEE